jgi:hypothetical protein
LSIPLFLSPYGAVVKKEVGENEVLEVHWDQGYATA